jgi:hypothetical protein
MNEQTGHPKALLSTSELSAGVALMVANGRKPNKKTRSYAGLMDLLEA